MNPTLSRWSWQDLQKVYASLGKVLQSYEEIAQRIEIPKAHIDQPDEVNTFAFKWHTDIKRVDSQLGILDREIAWRNNLIGVMG